MFSTEMKSTVAGYLARWIISSRSGQPLSKTYSDNWRARELDIRLDTRNPRSVWPHYSPVILVRSSFFRHFTRASTGRLNFRPAVSFGPVSPRSRFDGWRAARSCEDIFARTFPTDYLSMRFFSQTMLMLHVRTRCEIVWRSTKRVYHCWYYVSLPCYDYIYSWKIK